MFTGIVEAVGVVRRVEPRETTRLLEVEVPPALEGLRPGASVSVDGACLTVAATGEASLVFDVIGTTLRCTVAGRYAPGTRVNLERALEMSGRLEGHLVQGHVDGLGELIQTVKVGEHWLLDVRLPEDVARLTVVRGSIALNGVSLTVADMPAADVCRIGLVPFTMEHTNLGGLQPGDPVNVEGDLIGKYVGKMLAPDGRPPADSSHPES